MPYSVVCISRTLGAGGEEIGRALAARLGFRYVDEEIIVRAAKLAQVSPELVAATERKQPLLRRLLDKLAAAQEMVDPVAFATGMPLELFQPTGRGPRADADDLRLLIRAAIHEVADEGRAVIVAHAASHALAERGDALRVLVTASDANRRRRIAADRGLDDKQADAELMRSDRERADYFRSFYDLKQELPTHYDLVVNTDALDAEAVARVITAALG